MHTLYHASKHDCDPCPIRPRCCPKTPARKVPRSIYEGARDMARDFAKTDEARNIPEATQEGRDAVRAPQAHPASRPAPITRTERRPRRVPSRSHRPEPQEARQTDPDANTRTGVRRSLHQRPCAVEAKIPRLVRAATSSTESASQRKSQLAQAVSRLETGSELIVSVAEGTFEASATGAASRDSTKSWA